MVELVENKKHIIIKRDGREEQYCEKKLRKVIMWATNNSETFTDSVLKNFNIKINNKMKIQVLYDELINTVVNMISPIYSDFQYVAEKLYLLKIYKESWNISKVNNYPHLKEFLYEGIKSNVYGEEIFNYFDEEEIEKINNYIKPERDFLYTYKSLIIMYQKYCKKYKGKKTELPQISYMIAAMYSFYKDKKEERLELIKKTYDLLSLHQVTFATPRMLNSGLTKAQLASCVLTTPSDDTWSLNQTDSVIAMYSKYSGGIAYDVSYVRSSGSFISNNKGKSDGPIPFIKRVESTISAFNQNGCVYSLANIPVIESIELDNGMTVPFIKEKPYFEQYFVSDFGNNKELKSLHTRLYRYLDNGYTLNGYRTKGKEISIVKINEKIINILDAKKGMYVRSFNKKLKKVEYKKIDETFRFNVPLEEQNYLKFDNNVEFVTSNDHPIFYLENDEVKYKPTIDMKVGDLGIDGNGNSSKLLINKKSNIKYEFADLTVRGNNNYFVSSPNNPNEFILIHNTRKGSAVISYPWWHYDVQDLLMLKDAGGTEDLRARKLQYAIKLNNIFRERINKNETITLFSPHQVPLLLDSFGEDFEKYYKMYEEKSGIMKKKIRARELLYLLLKVRKETGNLYITFVDNINEQNVRNVFVGASNLCCVSGDSTILLDSGNQKFEDIVIDKNKIYEKTVWNGYNYIVSKIYCTNRYEDVFVLNFNYENKIIPVECTNYHRWILSRNDIKKIPAEYIINNDRVTTETLIKYLPLLKKIELKNYNLPNDLKDQSAYIIYDNNKNIEIKNNILTYCAEVPLNNSFIVNSFIFTGNCEITVPSSPSKLIESKLIKDLETDVTYIEDKKESGEIGICNLFSINLVSWDKYTEKEKEDYIYVLLRGSDNILDTQYYPVKEGEYSNKRNRPIGVGVLNYANLLASKKIKFTDNEALEFTNKIFDDLYYHVYKGSVRLSKERGSYESFKFDKWIDGKTPFQLSLLDEKKFNLSINKEKWDKLAEEIKIHGVRFSLHGAIAPTATSGKSINATESIEPINSLFYIEEGTLILPTLVSDIKENREYYQRCWEIPAKRLIELAAIRQRYIDQAQSVNLYYVKPESAKELWDDIQYAMDLGLKTLYYMKTPKDDSVLEEICESCT